MISLHVCHYFLTFVGNVSHFWYYITVRIKLSESAVMITKKISICNTLRRNEWCKDIINDAVENLANIHCPEEYGDRSLLAKVALNTTSETLYIM